MTTTKINQSLISLTLFADKIGKTEIKAIYSNNELKIHDLTLVTHAGNEGYQIIAYLEQVIEKIKDLKNLSK